MSVAPTADRSTDRREMAPRPPPRRVASAGGFPADAFFGKSHHMRASLSPRRRRLLRLTALLAGGLQLPVTVHAQRAAGRDSLADSTRSTARLQAVQVSVTRDLTRSPFELPYALSSAPIASRPALRRTGLGDLLTVVPGVQVFDRANPSQDPRLTIRGFGARSAFGTRGVRVVRDGVPVSLPDGQTPLDWVDLETVGGIDVVRGTAAALYGNAAGGVVALRSRDIPTAPVSSELRLWDGAGLRRSHAMVSMRRADTVGRVQEPRAMVALTRTQGDGARQWSRLDATSAFGRVLATVAGTRIEVQGTHYDAPRAENTGALTAAELVRDPRLPDSLNVTKRSRKAATQSQLAMLAERDVPAGTLRANLFVGSRALDNPLPFAIVAVDRTTSGGGVHGAWRTTAWRWPIRLGLGVDLQQQRDARYNYENCADLAPAAPRTVRCPTLAERGARRLDQLEQVVGGGAYGRIEVEAHRQLFLSGAVRTDAVRFRVTDRFVSATNADDSGERRLGAVTPMMGVVWRMRPQWSWHANVSTAFETPTITELTNQVDGAAGLNRLLDPQRTRTIDVGTQAFLAGHFRLEAAAFRALIQDELVPFDVPNQPGRRAFRNAGQSTRTGTEVAVRGAWSAVDAGVAHSWSHFRFVQYQVGSVSYAGRAVPGVPVHLLQGFVTMRRRALFGTAETVMSSRVAADDAGSVWASGSAVWNARLGADGLRVGRVRIDPSVGVENLFDRRAVGAVVINATRGRFFEPTLPRRVTAVVRLEL